MKYYSAKQAAEILGYNPNYLRDLEKQGKIACIRTTGGHRRYDVDSFIKATSKPDSFITVCYCRVSSAKQRDDLERQVPLILFPFCAISRSLKKSRLHHIATQPAYLQGSPTLPSPRHRTQQRSEILSPLSFIDALVC